MPTVAEALQIGWRRHQAGEFAAAESIYRQVLQAAPRDENAWCFLGMACHDQTRYDEALAAYEQALRIKADFPVALNNLANTLKQLGRLDEAIERCREALRCKPDYGTAYNNLGVALVAQGRLAEASASFQKSLELTPNDVVARVNLGATLVRQGRFDEGGDIARQALRLNPNYAEAHKNQAIVWLLLGDFERGWPEYEWRWKCPGSPPPAFTQPLWDGSPLARRTILLAAEQGLGDTIHFVRYAQVLRDAGARTVVACQKPLLRLLRSCPGIDELVDQKATPPVCDVAAPLMSVPGLLRTTLATIPAPIPYLAAEPRLVAQWRERLRSLPGFRIGIAWQGSASFHADRQRSIPLAAFAPLAAVPGVRLISLQKGLGAEQLPSLRGAFDVADFAAELDETNGPFMDTAAIIANLDLVVTADTSIGHLAGALGAPVWIALSLSPDWRWLLDRDDSPWYPTARLFRQRTLGDWEEVFHRIAEAAAGRAAAVAAETVSAAPAERSSEISRSVPSGHGAELANDCDADRHGAPATTGAVAVDAGKPILVEISAGELLDKITILEIKEQRIGELDKRGNVCRELESLRAARERTMTMTPALASCVAELRAANESLWRIEDEIRECERRQDFGAGFIALARAVYRHNDRRSAIKRAINELAGSRIVEEKSYAPYDVIR